MFGFFGGLLVGLILAFLLEFMDDTLRTSEEVEVVSHLPTLAVIPHFPIKKSAVAAKSGHPNLLPDVVPILRRNLLGRRVSARCARRCFYRLLIASRRCC